MRWMWIDRVVSLEPGKMLVAVKNVSLAEEHLHDHFAADPANGLAACPVMPSSLILEGVAQASGILVGHSSGFTEKVVLAKVGRAEIRREVGPGCTLRYTTRIERMDTAGASISATIELFDHARPDEDYQPIGEVEMIFSHLDKNMAGTTFPKHNFAFGDGFKTLLRASGIAIED